MRCPGCKGTDVHRSRTRWYDLPFRLMSLRAYRCHSCLRRFYRRRPADEKAPPDEDRPAVSRAMATPHESGILRKAAGSPGLLDFFRRYWR